jgi:hypothetical protein
MSLTSAKNFFDDKTKEVLERLGRCYWPVAKVRSVVHDQMSLDARGLRDKINNMQI